MKRGDRSALVTHSLVTTNQPYPPDLNTRISSSMSLSLTLTLLNNRLPQISNLDSQLPITNHMSSQFLQRFLLSFFIGDFDESESFRSRNDFGRESRLADDGGGLDMDAEIGKELGQGGIVDSEREVGDKDRGL